MRGFTAAAKQSISEAALKRSVDAQVRDMLSKTVKDRLCMEGIEFPDHMSFQKAQEPSQGKGFDAEDEKRPPEVDDGFCRSQFITGAILTGAFVARAFYAGAFVARAFYAGAFVARAFYAGAFVARAFASRVPGAEVVLLFLVHIIILGGIDVLHIIILLGRIVFSFLGRIVFSFLVLVLSFLGRIVFSFLGRIVFSFLVLVLSFLVHDRIVLHIIFVNKRSVVKAFVRAVVKAFVRAVVKAFFKAFVRAVVRSVVIFKAFAVLLINKTKFCVVVF